MAMLIGLFVTLFLFATAAVIYKDKVFEFFRDSDKDSIAFGILMFAIAFCFVWAFWPFALFALVVYLVYKRITK